MEVRRDWYFTFGGAHAFPNGFVKIHGTYGEARDQMVQWFGDKWAFQYPSAEEAGVERFNLKEVHCGR